MSPFLNTLQEKRNKSITLNLGYQGAQAFERQVEGIDGKPRAREKGCLRADVSYILCCTWSLFRVQQRK